MDMRLIKARRCARRVPREAWDFFCEPVFNAGQILTLAAAMIGLWIVLQNASAAEREMEITQWSVGVQAFAYALIGWAVISMICAPFISIKKDREKGGWLGPRRIYNEPVLVGLAVFTNQDADKTVRIHFPDAEPDSFVSYIIELDPPVGHRASCYLEQSPGHLGGIIGSIRSVKNGAATKIGGRGGTRLSGLFSYLRVKLEPETIPVTARVYMTGFEVGNA